MADTCSIQTTYSLLGTLDVDVDVDVVDLLAGPCIILVENILSEWFVIVRRYTAKSWMVEAPASSQLESLELLT
jgi:hypothetical protein